MSGSLESALWNACVHRLDLGLCSHPKEFWGNESEPMLKPLESTSATAVQKQKPLRRLPP